MFFFFGALPNDKLKIKHTKKWKEIPSRYVLKNLLEKSKHSCLYTSVTHWQFTGILPIYNGRHSKSKYLNIAKSGEKIQDRFKRKVLLNDYDFWQFSINPWYMRVYGKLRKLEKNEF